MKLRDYIYINSIPTDISDKEREERLIKYMGLDYSKDSLDKINDKVHKLYDMKSISEVKILYKYFRVGKKIWKVERNIRTCPASQFILFDSYINNDDIISNLHNILSIYIRPVRWYGKIEKWNPDNHQKNSETLLNVDMKYIYPMISFFFHSVMKYMKNINIIYLNQQTQENRKMTV